MIRKEFHTHHQTIPHPLKKRRRTVAAPPNTRVSCKPHIFIPPPAIPYTRTITLEPSFQHHLVAALHPTISLHAASFNANVITTAPPPPPLQNIQRVPQYHLTFTCSHSIQRIHHISPYFTFQVSADFHLYITDEEKYSIRISNAIYAREIVCSFSERLERTP